MFTEVEEIAPDIFRLSTHIEEVAPPAGFTFNQFLIRGDEPFLFHTGMRGLFPLVSEAVNRIVPVTDLRWISFAHVEADECGAMNDFLAVAPNAQVVHGNGGKSGHEPLPRLSHVRRDVGADVRAEEE